MFGLILIVALGTGSSIGAPGPALQPKSFAVFSVNYEPGSREVRGGVGGTAFFIDRNTAITAYHVLQPLTFKPENPKQRRRVWLVREHFRPIELKPEYLSYRPELDMTVIRIPKGEAVPPQLTYETMQASALVGGPALEVETNGFLANSAGPDLNYNGLSVEIVNVRHLERRNLKGRLLSGVSLVTLSATDLNIKDSPCVQVSYEPIVGISGGPVLVAGRVIGMNSFADPRTRKHTWALRINGAI